MKRKSIYLIVLVLLALILLSLYFLNIANIRYFFMKTTDLSTENINNIGLNQEYDNNSIQNIFGQFKEQNNTENYTEYLHVSTSKTVNIKVQDNKIIEISTQDYSKNKIKTNKNITFKSSFEEVASQYGDSYKKTSYSDEMGSGRGYSIIYIDKSNKFKLEFGFTQIDNEDKMNFMGLSKY